MECEICGAETDTLYEIEIEGATMLVCSVCAKGKHLTGKVVGEKGEAAHARQAPARPDVAEHGQELVDD